MSYGLWKLVHIVGVVLFLGNITTGLFWAWLAHRRGDFPHIATTFEGIIKSDRWFTMPGVYAILAGGIGAAIVGKFPILGTGWILWPSILFAASGIVFAIFVAPLQKKILRFTAEAQKSESSWGEYRALYRRWEVWGLVAWAAPVVALVIMVLKLPLPGL